MKQTRRNFLQWLFGFLPLFTGLFSQFRARGATTADIPTASEPGRSELTFLIFGDWGRGGEFHQSDVANQMGLAATKRRCRFIVSVGDNFYEKGVRSADDPQWKSSFEGVYTAPSLNVPWYAILGNHDQPELIRAINRCSRNTECPLISTGMIMISNISFADR